MKVVVDPWDPAYGAATDAEALADSVATVNLDIEVPAPRWRPIGPGPATIVPDVIVFVDGVRRVDARVWVAADDASGAEASPGVCATWAAGAVRCAERAELVSARVERGLFSASPHAAELVTRHGSYPARTAGGDSPEQLWIAIQNKMAEVEHVVAEQARVDHPGALLLVDGPLRGRGHLVDTVGLVKTHQRAYLQGAPAGVLAALRPGERTPAFTIGSAFPRHSWYVRLPGGGRAPLAGVLRCECSTDVAPDALVRLADATTALLPRYASAPHKDSRAPQNLYPIAGLERELRRRLGDARVLYRGLCLAAG
jgi:hypothetical protein